MPKFYFLIDNEQVGPFEEAKVYQLIKEGKVGKQAYIRTESDEVWRPAHEKLPGISSGLSRTARLTIVAGLLSLFVCCPTSVGLSIYWGFREVAFQIRAFVVAIENIDEVGTEYFDVFRGFARGFMDEVSVTKENDDWLSGIAAPSFIHEGPETLDTITIDGRSIEIISSWTQNKVGYTLLGSFIGLDGTDPNLLEPVTYLIVEVDIKNASRENWEVNTNNFLLNVENQSTIQQNLTGFSIIALMREDSTVHSTTIPPNSSRKTFLVYELPLSWLNDEASLVIPESILNISEEP